MVRELHKNLQLDVSYLNSRTSYLFVVEPFTAASPTDASYMGLTNTGSSKYHELEASVRYTFRDSDQLKASYIWSHARGDLNNLSSVMIPFAAPVFRPDVYGILASDIPNRFVAWGIFALPWKITFSPLVDVHSGFPYSSIDVTQQYVGTPNGQRFPTYFSLDLKAYRTFRIPFLERQKRERTSLPPGRLLAERHQSWKFQHRLQQRGISRLWQVCRISLPPRRHDPRLCGLNYGDFSTARACDSVT